MSRQTARRHERAPFTSLPGDVPAGGQEQPLSKLLADEREAALLAALKMIPRVQRRIIEERYLKSACRVPRVQCAARVGMSVRRLRRQEAKAVLFLSTFMKEWRDDI